MTKIKTHFTIEELRTFADSLSYQKDEWYASDCEIMHELLDRFIDAQNPVPKHIREHIAALEAAGYKVTKEQS